MKNRLLKIINLDASISNKLIIKNFNLNVNENEIHVIMGPNGSGKSTLSKILTGHPAYQLEKGEVFFNNQDIFSLAPEIRSHEGLFLAFQYPVEIPGVTNYDFLRLAYNEKQKYLKKQELDPLEFMEFIQKYLKKLKITDDYLNRNLNEGFSGGEKKKNEILQMLILEPKLIILDEIDSGLDMDAIKLICDGILNNREKNTSLIIITHYPKMLTYLNPDYVHIMIDGQIVKTGTSSLIPILEENGYEFFRKT
jgi:Fe-S cluster assembly ATP-binding protein